MPAPDEIARFSDVPIEIEAQLDRRMLRVSELLSLEPGQLIPLERSAGDTADILAGGAPFAYGEILVVEDKLAVRVTDFVTPAAAE